MMVGAKVSSDDLQHYLYIMQIESSGNKNVDDFSQCSRHVLSMRTFHTYSQPLFLTTSAARKPTCSNQQITCDRGHTRVAWHRADELEVSELEMEWITNDCSAITPSIACAADLMPKQPLPPGSPMCTCCWISRYLQRYNIFGAPRITLSNCVVYPLNISSIIVIEYNTTPWSAG